MLTVIGIVLVLALVFLVISAIGKMPLWPSVLCLIIIELLRLLPLGK